MTEEATHTPMHVKTWTLKLDLFEAGDTTTAHGVLDTGDNVLESRSSAHRNPQDAAVPEIGDEYAAGRALMELGHRLLVAGMHDAAANTPATGG